MFGTAACEFVYYSCAFYRKFICVAMYRPSSLKSRNEYFISTMIALRLAMTFITHERGNFAESCDCQLNCQTLWKINSTSRYRFILDFNNIYTMKELHTFESFQIMALLDLINSDYHKSKWEGDYCRVIQYQVHNLSEWIEGSTLFIFSYNDFYLLVFTWCRFGFVTYFCKQASP